MVRGLCKQRRQSVQRALSATRKRHAHRLANPSGTNIQNRGQIGIQNAVALKQFSTAK
jgi:hypothetical protein